jgi:HEPN domain-containing protein
VLAWPVAERSRDWLRQADADLRHARNARDAGDYDWSAFAAQQAAEKAIKAVFQRLHLDAWGHVLSVLLANLPGDTQASVALIDAAKELDKHYIPTRYPNGFERGAPTDFYTRREAEQAIGNAEAILEWCRRQVG